MFDIKIEQKELMDILTVISSTGKEAGSCISMTCDKSGILEMYTTTGIEFSKISVAVASNSKTADTAPYVNFGRFKNIIATIPPTEQVSLKSNGNDLTINFQNKRQPIKLTGMTQKIMSLPGTTGYTNQVYIPISFAKEILDEATAIINDSESAPLFNCVKIDTNNGDVCVTGLDVQTKRMFKHEYKSPYVQPQASYLIEASKLKKALKMFCNYTDLMIEENNAAIHIQGHSPATNTLIPNVTSADFYMRKISGVFPSNIKSSIDQGAVEFCEVDKEDILNVLIRANAVEDKTIGNGTITFDVVDDTITITNGSAYGMVEDSILMNNKVQNQIHCNFKYEALQQILRAIPSDLIEIGSMKNYKSHFIVRMAGNNEVSYTIPEMVIGQQTP